MKKIILSLIISGILAAVIFIFLMNYPIIRNGKNKFVNLKICDNVFLVEIADTEEVKIKGLGKRESLGEKEGMLFLFDKSDIRHFWMKDMNFPIDIVWINGDKIVGSSENLEPAKVGESPIIYLSPTAVDKVLEIKAGAFKKIGAKIFGNLSDFNNGCGRRIEVLSL